MTINAGMTGGGQRSARCAALRTIQGDAEVLLYAVRMRDGLVKIGATSDPVERLSHLDYTEILAVGPGRRSDEREIHLSLRGRGCCVRGHEWYRPTPSVMAIVNQMRSAMGAEPIAS